MADPLDPDTQAIYNELNARGLLKGDPDLQSIGHEMRARGLVFDPSQGGTVTPPPTRQPLPARNGDPYGDPAVTHERTVTDAPLSSNAPTAPNVAPAPTPPAPRQAPGTPNAYQQQVAAHNSYLAPRDAGFEANVQNYTKTFLDPRNPRDPGKILNHVINLPPSARLAALPSQLSEVGKAAILRQAYNVAGTGSGSLSPPAPPPTGMQRVAQGLDAIGQTVAAPIEYLDSHLSNARGILGTKGAQDAYNQHVGAFMKAGYDEDKAKDLTNQYYRDPNFLASFAPGLAATIRKIPVIGGVADFGTSLISPGNLATMGAAGAAAKGGKALQVGAKAAGAAFAGSMLKGGAEQTAQGVQSIQQEGVTGQNINQIVKGVLSLGMGGHAAFHTLAPDNPALTRQYADNGGIVVADANAARKAVQTLQKNNANAPKVARLNDGRWAIVDPTHPAMQAAANAGNVADAAQPASATPRARPAALPRTPTAPTAEQSAGTVAPVSPQDAASVANVAGGIAPEGTTPAAASQPATPAPAISPNLAAHLAELEAQARANIAARQQAAPTPPAPVETLPNGVPADTPGAAEIGKAPAPVAHAETLTPVQLDNAIAAERAHITQAGGNPDADPHVQQLEAAKARQNGTPVQENANVHASAPQPNVPEQPRPLAATPSADVSTPATASEAGTAELARPDRQGAGKATEPAASGGSDTAGAQVAEPNAQPLARARKGKQTEPTANAPAAAVSGSRTYYHLTPAENVDSIRQNGLRASEKGELGPGVYLIEDPKVLTDTRFKDAHRVQVHMPDNVKLLDVKDGANIGLQVLRTLYGTEEGSRRYNAMSQEEKFTGAYSQPNWSHYHHLIQEAGYGGIHLIDGASKKNTLIFDPKNAQVQPDEHASAPAWTPTHEIVTRGERVPVRVVQDSGGPLVKVERENGQALTPTRGQLQEIAPSVTADVVPEKKAGGGATLNTGQRVSVQIGKQTLSGKIHDVMRLEQQGGALTYAVDVEKPTRTPGKTRIERQLIPAESVRALDVAKTAPAEPMPAPKSEPIRGKADIAYTPNNTRVPFHYSVVDAGDLVTSHGDNFAPNPAYDPALQPRDRSRMASNAQVQDIAARLTPERVTTSHSTAEGAPIIGPDYQVESGNGRAMGIRRAYAQDGPTAKQYREYLKFNAGEYGLTPSQIDGVKNPVLVRVSDMAHESPEARARFASEAGANPIAGMSAAETARQDGQRLRDNGLLQHYQGGNVTSRENLPFVRSFLSTLSPGEQAPLIQANGSLSVEGVRRVRSAILASAYGDSGAVEKLLEDTDGNIKNVGATLQDTAPRMAKIREDIARGERYPLDITADVAAAAERLAHLRATNTQVAFHLEQLGLFGDDLTPEAQSLLRLMDTNKRSPKRLTQILTNYADGVDALGNPAQTDLFGESSLPTKEELLQTAVERADEQASTKQQSGFDFADAPDATPADAPGNDRVPERQDAGLSGEAGSAAPASGESTPKLTDRANAALDKIEERAQRRLRDKLSRLNAGLDPEALKDFATLGAVKIARGVLTFADFAADMTRDFGETVAPHLQDLWQAAKDQYHAHIAPAFNLPTVPDEQATETSGNVGTSAPQENNTNARIVTNQNEQIRTSPDRSFADVSEPSVQRKQEPADMGVAPVAQEHGASDNARSNETPPAIETQTVPATHVVENDSALRSTQEPTAKTGASAEDAKKIRDGGNAEIGTNNPSTVTKAANVHAAEERAGIGLSELPASERKPVADAFEQAKAEGRATGAKTLAEQVIANPRNLSDVETAGLVQRMQAVKERVEQVRHAIEQAAQSGDSAQATSLKAEHADLLAEYDTLDKARKIAGREWARSGLARQVEINDYDYIGARQRMIAADPTKALTPDEDAKVSNLTARLTETERKLAEAQQKVSDLSAQRVVRRMAQEDALERRQTGRAKTRAALDTELDTLKTQFVKTASKASAGLDPELAALVGKMAKNRVAAGINTVAGLVDDLYTTLSPHVQNLTPRDIRDAISGYGKQTTPADPSSPAAKLRDLQAQMRLVSSIEDAQAKQPPVRGAAPVRPSQEVRELRAQLNDLMQQNGLNRPNDPLPAIKTRLQAQIASLQEHLANETEPPKQTRTPTPLDAEGEALKAQRDQLRYQIDQMVARRQKPTAADYLARWQRLSVLSGVGTLAKLGAAAAGRVVTSPLEEMVGAGIGKVLPGLAQKAPREGRAYMGAEVAAVKELFNPATLADMKQKLTTGANSLDMAHDAHGHDTEAYSPLWDFFGGLHGAIKTPVQRAEFARAVAKRTAFAVKSGVDISAPDAQIQIGAAAYLDSKRAILMGDNVAVDIYRNAMSYAKRQGAGGKAIAAGAQTLMPIVKVPSNFISEAGNYVGGAAIGAGKLAAANAVNEGGTAAGLKKTFSRQIFDGLTAEQADGVLRAFKKQGVGAGLLALGYLGAGGLKAGGYYAPGQQNKDGLKPGEIEWGGHVLPHSLAHTPALEAIQFGATLRRALDATRGRDALEQSGEALAQAGGGMLKEVPFVDQAARTGEAVKNSGSMGKFAGGVAASVLVPQGVQQAARGELPGQRFLPGALKGDVDASGNTVQRSPKGFRDTVKQAVPGLRQQVPVKGTKGGNGRTRPPSDEVTRQINRDMAVPGMGR